MGQKKEPKKTDEEKAAEKIAKLNASLVKACKNDECAKVEEYVSKGASVNFVNEKGEQSVAHIAAAFGALDVLRFLYKNGADFTAINAKKQTPLDAAKFIGEENAVKLIEALLAGESGEGIGADEAEELGDEMGAVDIGDEAPGSRAESERGAATAKEPAADAAGAPTAPVAAVGA